MMSSSARTDTPLCGCAGAHGRRPRRRGARGYFCMFSLLVFYRVVSLSVTVLLLRCRTRLTHNSTYNPPAVLRLRGP
jgi:hypothetical protein